MWTHVQLQAVSSGKSAQLTVSGVNVMPDYKKKGVVFAQLLDNVRKLNYIQPLSFPYQENLPKNVVPDILQRQAGHFNLLVCLSIVKFD